MANELEEKVQNLEMALKAKTVENTKLQEDLQTVKHIHWETERRLGAITSLADRYLKVIENLTASMKKE